ncbi:MAG: hypothetical protein P8X90_22080 [Desulfobacterales bacterium]
MGVKGVKSIKAAIPIKIGYSILSSKFHIVSRVLAVKAKKGNSMKQKYRIWKNVKGKNLHIQEYAVLSADSRKQKLPGLQDDDFSLLCEQVYEAEEVKKASSKGKDELIFYLRNQHFFPIGVYMDLIADAVIGMYESKGEQNENLIFDDKIDLLGDSGELEPVMKIENEKEVESEEEIDDLLADDSEYDEGNSAGSIPNKQFDEDEDY